MFRGPMMPDHHYHRLVDGDIKVKIQNIFMILFDFEEYSCGVRLFASWSYSNSNNDSKPKDPV